MNEWTEHRILIWGKTYPELSSKYYETVCTGGVLENGQFIRLYPIPFRYLSNDKTFAKYQWIKAKIKKSQEDPRPESYKVDPSSIISENSIPTDPSGWYNRHKEIFKIDDYIFNSVDELLVENRKRNTSMGFIKPIAIEKIEIEERPEEDYETFVRKIKSNNQKLQQTQLFEIVSIQELRELQYVSKRFKIHWKCKENGCKGHKMTILDWEAYELLRKVGLQKALLQLNSILDLKIYDIGFFLGNFRLHPKSFAIGGIWYPKRKKQPINLNLFD